MDITKQVEGIVEQAKVQNGVVCLYAQGATAAIMIQENWDDSIRQPLPHPSGDYVETKKALNPQ